MRQSHFIILFSHGVIIVPASKPCALKCFHSHPPFMLHRNHIKRDKKVFSLIFQENMKRKKLFCSCRNQAERVWMKNENQWWWCPSPSPSFWHFSYLERFNKLRIHKIMLNKEKVFLYCFNSSRREKWKSLYPKRGVGFDRDSDNSLTIDLTNLPFLWPSLLPYLAHNNIKKIKTKKVSDCSGCLRDMYTRPRWFMSECLREILMTAWKKLLRAFSQLIFHLNYLFYISLQHSSHRPSYKLRPPKKKDIKTNIKSSTKAKYKKT